jgi:hypothetical protein
VQTSTAEQTGIVVTTDLPSSSPTVAASNLLSTTKDLHGVTLYALVAGAGIALLVAAGVSYYFFVWKPKHDKMRDMVNKISPFPSAEDEVEKGEYTATSTTAAISFNKVAPAPDNSSISSSKAQTHHHPHHRDDGTLMMQGHDRRSSAKVRPGGHHHHYRDPEMQVRAATHVYDEDEDDGDDDDDDDWEGVDLDDSYDVDSDEDYHDDRDDDHPHHPPHPHHEEEEEEEEEEDYDTQSEISDHHLYDIDDLLDNRWSK